MPSLLPDYTWDPRLRKGQGGYRNAATGRVVSRLEIVSQLDKAAEISRSNIESASRALVNKEISLADWQRRMAQEIKNVHVMNAAAARGGWAQMSPSDWGRVGWNVRKQYEYLRNRALEIASGKQALNGQLIAIAKMYGRAGHATFEDMRQRDAERSNLTEEKRVLNARESCVDCINYASRGWQPIGTLPRIGASICKTNCRCHFEYR